MSTSSRSTRGRAVAFLASAAVVAAAGLVPAAEAAPGHAATGAPRTVVKKFGYHSIAYGANLVTGNIQVANLRDAYAGLPCTTKLGVDRSVDSAVALPANPLIQVSGSTSQNQTYRTGTRYGTRGINTLANVAIGGTVNGTPTPELKIQGLRTTADAFNQAGRYGHKESFTFKGMTLTLPSTGTPIDPALQQLLNALQQPAGQVSGAVTQVLTQVGVPIVIPGLGSIALGHMHGSTGAHAASSYSEALVVTINATGENQSLTLGHAFARTGGPVPGGVFRTDGAAIDVQALNGLAHYQLHADSIPCEGTQGRVVTTKVPSASLLAGVLMKATGITKSHMGRQWADGRAKGWSSESVARFEIPALQLVLTGINAKVSVSHKPGQRRVRHTISSSLGSITAGGKSYAVPAPGKTVALPNGVWLTTAVGGYDPHGARIRAVKLTIPSVGVIYLGWADTHLNPKG